MKIAKMGKQKFSFQLYVEDIGFVWKAHNFSPPLLPPPPPPLPVSRRLKKNKKSSSSQQQPLET
jgi:hypothetical protein